MSPQARLTALTAFAALTFGAPVAQAFSPMLVPNMMQAVVLNPCQPGTPCGDAAAQTYGISPYKVLPKGGMDQVTAEARARGAVKGNAAGGAAPPAIAYTPSPEVSAQVKARYTRMLTQTLPPPQAQKISAALGPTDVLGAWSRAMAPQGLRPNDVADAVASYWLLNWMEANHADATSTQAQAVRNQISRVMAAGPIGQLANGDRQEMSEMMIYQFIVESSLYENAMKTRDVAKLASMGDAAEQRFNTNMKIDLRALNLTNMGFVRKA